jgi:hypothetical protein
VLGGKNSMLMGSVAAWVMSGLSGRAAIGPRAAMS